jgi:hypothetical protein
MSNDELNDFKILLSNGQTSPSACKQNAKELKEFAIFEADKGIGSVLFEPESSPYEITF